MRKILFVLAISLLMASCGKKSSESSYIPKDATGVMYVNLKSLSEKSSDVNFKDLQISKMIESEAPKELRDFINKNMTSENIDKVFRKEYILGFISIKAMNPIGGLILPIKDAASFEELLQPILKEGGARLEKEENVGKGDAFTVYSDRDLAIGWNGKVALVVVSDRDASNALKELTELEKSNSILATNYFNTFFNGSKDVGMYLTSTPAATKYGLMAKNRAGIDADLKDNSFSYHTSFENDHVYASTKLELNDDIQSLLGFKKWMKKDYDASLLIALPSNPKVLVKMSIDPQAFYNHIVSLKDNKVFPAAAKPELERSLKNANREVQRNLDMSMEDLSKVFEGTFMMAINEGKTVKDTVYSYSYYGDEDDKYQVVDRKIPNMYAAIGLEDKAKFDKILDAMKNDGAPMKEKAQNYYSIGRGNEAVNFVITDNYLFVTNDTAKADELSQNGKLANNLSDFKHKSNLSHAGYIYANGNMSTMMQDIMPRGYSRYGNNPMDEINKVQGELYEKYIGESHFYFDAENGEGFTYTKGDKNSLVQSIMYMDEFMKVMMEKGMLR